MGRKYGKENKERVYIGNRILVTYIKGEYV